MDIYTCVSVIKIGNKKIKIQGMNSYQIATLDIIELLNQITKYKNNGMARKDIERLLDIVYNEGKQLNQEPNIINKINDENKVK